MTSVSVSQDFILPGSGDQDLSDSNTTAEMQDEENLESLLDGVEQQQRWIYLILKRASLMCTAYDSHSKKSRELAELDFSNLEASLSESSLLSHELANLFKICAGEAQNKIDLAEKTAQTAWKELNEVHSERIASEVEATQQMRSLEKTFETVVREKDDELAVLRTQLMSALEESEALKTELSNERAISKGLKTSEAAKERNSTGSPGLVHAALEALWQVSSSAHQADMMHAESPALLTSIFQQMKSIYDSTTFLLPIAPKGVLPPNLEILPSLWGIMVNIAATSQGRKKTAELERGQFLVFLVSSVEKIVGRIAKHSSQADIGVLELSLCVLSNLAAEKVYAVKLLELGLIDQLQIVISSRATIEIRRYAIEMIKVNMDFVPFARKEFHSPIIATIGLLIGTLSKNAQLKVAGHDLLVHMYRIMPSEDD